MKEELTGRVGCVKTHHVEGDVVQNFSLCVEEIINDGIPRLHTTWHNVTARNLEKVNKGDKVTVIGLTRGVQYIHSDGYTRELKEFIVNLLIKHKDEIQ